MRSPEELAKLAVRMGQEEGSSYLKLIAKQESDNAQRLKNEASRKLAIAERKQKQAWEDLTSTGESSDVAMHQNFLRLVFMGVLFTIACVGEFNFLEWTVRHFGLGEIKTYFVAATMQIVSLEGVNLYLTSLRKKYPSFENHLFLILGSVSFVLILLMIFFAAEIREGLFRVQSITSAAPNLESTIKAVEEFYRNNSRKFMFLMVSLTTAFTIVGGIAYHDLRNRLFPTLSLRRLHRRLKKHEDEINEFNDRIFRLDSLLSDFFGSLDIAMREESFRQAERQKRKTTSSLFGGIQNTTENFRRTIVFPMVLILIAIILFLVLSRSVRGETLVFLDTSVSVGVRNYAGDETEFQQNVKAIDNYIQDNIVPGEDLKVLGITERSFSSPYVLLEGKITTNKGSFGEGIARDKLRLLNQWRKLNLKPKAEFTDLFGAMQLASVLFQTNSKDKRLIIFSDMRQYGQGFDFETPKFINVDTLFNEVLHKGLIPSLDGSKVWCLGVHSAGKSPAYWKGLKDFWTKYFHQSKVSELKAFTMERRVQNE